jgi:hypothetical protein
LISSKEIKDLSGGVKPTANLLILLYKKISNDFKHLAIDVKVYYKQLIDKNYFKNEKIQSFQRLSRKT